MFFKILWCSKILHCFGNIRHNLSVLSAFVILDAVVAWDSPGATYQICLYGLEHSLGIHTFRPTWPYQIIKILQPEQNFFCYLLSVLWLTAFLPFAQQMFLVASVVLWSSLNSLSIWSQIRLCYIFICMAFKKHIEWSNAYHVSALTTTKLSTTAGAFHNLNYFGHIIYMLQTSTYQNIAKHLIHPTKCQFDNIVANVHEINFWKCCL